VPSGLSKVEIRQLCKIYKKWFGDFEVLEKIFAYDRTGPDRNRNDQTQELSFVDLVVSEKLRDIEGEILIKINRDNF